MRAPISALAGRIASRVGRFLERHVLFVRNAESASVAEFALDDEPLQALREHSINYRIAVTPRAGRKVFALQALHPGDEGSGAAAGQPGGFSQHTGVVARADERKQLPRLIRYISLAAMWEARLSLTPGRTRALPDRDPVTRRHDARALRAAGFHHAAGCADG